jgi:2-methylcitrate dehydratase PrpD
MAQMGFSGVWDVFDGEHNVLQALSTDTHPEEMVADLGSRYYVTETAIKPYSVGYPIQAPLDAFLRLHREHRLTPENVKGIVVKLPEDGARVVNNRSMPDVNCQHIIAVALVKGVVSFEDSHSYEQMKDPQIRAVKDRVELIADPALMDPQAPRSGRVEVTLTDGRVVSHFTKHAPGTKENPLDTESVNAKARLLIEPVLGGAKAEEIIRRVNAAETLGNVRELARFLA